MGVCRCACYPVCVGRLVDNLWFWVGTSVWRGRSSVCTVQT